MARRYQRRNAISPTSIESIVIREVATTYSVHSRDERSFSEICPKVYQSLNIKSEKVYIDVHQGAAAA